MRIGDGPENLVVLPGITLDNRPPGRLVTQAHRSASAASRKINRRTNMPPGWTTRQTVADYARHRTGPGPSYVMGLSTGGLIAQHLVLDRPELVRRLALVVTVAQLSEKRRRTCERWRELAHREECGSSGSPCSPS